MITSCVRYWPAPVLFPESFEIADLRGVSSSLPNQEASRTDQLGLHSLGCYGEKREGLYLQPLFGAIRNIHMGLDFFAPLGTPVFSVAEGQVLFSEYRGEAGDYGGTLILEHRWQQKPLYALYGHLSKRSVERWNKDRSIHASEVLGWMGTPEENGGWEVPHLHFQLSWERPSVCDMPGVVSDADFLRALGTYPNPSLVLGPRFETYASEKIP